MLYAPHMRLTRSSRIYLAAGLLALGPSALAQSTTLGVVYLNSNTPNPDAAWIGRGLADMLTTDLSKIGKLTVVQREQLDKVLKEQALGASGAVDPGKAAQLGKILGVQTLLTGSYAAIGRNVRVDLQLVNTSTGRVEGGVTAEGSIDSIFSLEKQLVLAVINKLGVTPSPAEMQAILQPETLNNQAVILNYQALSQLQKDPKAAAGILQQAVDLDPNYSTAQQNLRTALSLSGASLANAAVLELDLKARELQAMRQVAELLKASVQITGVQLGSPSTRADEPGMVRIGSTGQVGLKPGTLAQVVRLLEPFSREGSGRRSIMFYAPGLGRGDQKKLWLSEESLDFAGSYLRRFKVWHAYYAKGNHPVFLNETWGFGTSNFSVAEFITSADRYGETGTTLPNPAEFELEEITMPIEVLRSITSSRALIIDNTTSLPEAVGEPMSYLYIDAGNARELGIPEGYLSNDSECQMKTRSGYFERLNFSELRGLGDIIELSGDCVIYTKLDDGDFNPQKLGQLINNGEDYTVTIYSLSRKNFTKRPRRGLIGPSEEWTYQGQGIEFKTTSLIKYGHLQHFELVPLTLPKAPTLKAFSIAPLF